MAERSKKRLSKDETVNKRWVLMAYKQTKYMDKGCFVVSEKEGGEETREKGIENRKGKD